MLATRQSQPENTAKVQNNVPFFPGHWVQPKLQVNEPGDQYEQEADAMADRVMRMAMPSMGDNQFFKSAQPTIQRKCQHCEEEEKLHRKESSGADVQGGAELDSYVNSLGSTGQAMSESSRQFFEPRFGQDFSNVRLHTDSIAAKSAQSINALAYTTGNNIVFNSGQYSPDSDSGKRLMAHELTHTIQQQGKNIATKRIQRAGGAVAIPPMACNIATTSPPPSALRSLFPTSSSVLTPAQRNDIATFVTSWKASGGTDPLRVDGYASVPGADELNWQLSCSRAVSVANELNINGVPNGMITILAHGETNEFGSQANNQVADISMPMPVPAHTPAPVPPPAPTPATAAVFSEDPSEQFAGYDASVAPNWLVVPVTGHRIARVTVTPSGSLPTFVSDAPGVATVAATATGIIVTGVSSGTANITAMAGTTVLATLQVSVKNQLSRSVAFHYVCDSAPAAAGGPHCSTHTPTAAAMLALLNNVWQLQSNILFTGGASSNITVPGDLGATVDSNGSGGGEMGTVTALGAGADYNVFRVWDLSSPVCGGCSGGLTSSNNSLIADTACTDGLGLPHEAGHFLGVGHGNGFIMTPCLTPRLNRRVSKAMTDTVNH